MLPYRKCTTRDIDAKKKSNNIVNFLLFVLEIKAQTFELEGEATCRCNCSLIRFLSVRFVAGWTNLSACKAAHGSDHE